MRLERFSFTLGLLGRHTHRALAQRGGLARTFGSLAGFLALTFLSVGFYLINDAWMHPVHAQSAALILGACALSSAAILLIYLLKPHRQLEAPREELSVTKGLSRRNQKMRGVAGRPIEELYPAPDWLRSSTGHRP